jgi:hypothetical protein
VDVVGRRWSLFVSGVGMGGLFFVVGGVLGWGGGGGGKGGGGGGERVEDKSKAMAAMLYLYVCFYSM